MHITEAKRELYNELKKNGNAITGAGIREANGSEVIVIYISHEDKSASVPSDYKGIPVITEVMEDPKMV